MAEARDSKLGIPSSAAENDPIHKTEEEKEKEEEEQQQQEEDRVKSMKPWEQHSAVISIPRYNYNAPSSLLINSHSGFLITCPIKREKSATKEVISILEKFLPSFYSCEYTELETPNGQSVCKRRKKLSEEGENECLDSSKCQDVSDNCKDSEASLLSSLKCDEYKELSLVKLTRSGLLFLTFPKDKSPPVVDVISSIIKSLESGNLKSPSWCHRILPIQGTCVLREKELQLIVTKLVNQFMNDKKNDFTRPLKFAVGYNRRGIEETAKKESRTTSVNSTESALLDRNKCFSTVAAAVKDAIPDSVVDLKCPELSVLIEVIPLSGIPETSIVVGVSILPQSLVITKPRLSIKTLGFDTKAKGKTS